MTSRNPGHAAGAHWHRYPRRRTYAAAFRVHAAALFRRFHAAALMPSLSRCHIYAASFTLQHALRHIYAAACTPQHASRSNAAALMPSLSRRGIGAAALILPHLFSTSHAAAFFGRSISPRISRCSVLPSHLRCPSRTAAFTLQLSRGRSAGGSGPLGAHFPTLSTTPAGGSRRGRARGGAGRGGGRFLKRGVLGWGGGRFMYVHIPERGV